MTTAYNKKTNEEAEWRICTRLVHYALVAHYSVSVFDGEVWQLIRSTDRARILDAMFGSTGVDAEKICFHTIVGTFVGKVLFQHGAGDHVIADWTHNGATNALVKETQ